MTNEFIMNNINEARMYLAKTEQLPFEEKEVGFNMCIGILNSLKTLVHGIGM